LNVGFIIAIAILFLSAAYHSSRKNQKKSAARSKVSERRALNPDTAFRCVEIRTSTTACLAARNYRGQKFLMENAPVLPLNACTNHVCDCRFVRYNDRRAGDRRSSFGIASEILENSQMIAAGNDRRSSNDRRKSMPAMA
jgi:hypothetical protein